MMLKFILTDRFILNWFLVTVLLLSPVILEDHSSLTSQAEPKMSLETIFQLENPIDTIHPLQHDPKLTTHAIMESSDDQESMAMLSGWLNIVWGDSKEGPDAEEKMLLFLTDIDGGITQVVLSSNSSLPDGGIINLDRQLVTIEGAWTPHAGVELDINIFAILLQDLLI